ncbi:MAG: class I SAM-dependent RNA methyltransferase, partial [Candidatus Omnitrophica bacterium]|nr:class I SAM-dependent RNA methyltransferase [Candidatus Omnitrophota bacterium]
MDQTDKESTGMIVPRCPYFGECGGCVYQDVSYDRELGLKQEQLRLILTEALPGWEGSIAPVVASPKEYHYRHRLDLRLLKT